MSFQKPAIIGSSQAIQKVNEITQKVACVDLNVLITGESGVGKELVARSLHFFSSRRQGPFIKVNSAALPSELIESELFGHEKGAFTGADRTKMGKFELASHGSIFLDEIGEIPFFIQAKLLQVLQDKIYYRVGGSKEVAVNARVIAATNQNLDQEMLDGHFRDDLFYRLSTISIHIPPLRERKEDLQELIDFFCTQMEKEYHLPRIHLSPHLMNLFYEYHWPGNVRELENYLKRLSVLENYSEIADKIQSNLSSENENSNPAPKADDEDRIPEEVLKHNLQKKVFPSLKEVRDQAVQRVEKVVIEKVLDETGWNRKRAAQVLKISYRALLYKMKDLNISPPYK
jgi:transcriptional regulator with PAS, ATPase and Fis domain